MKTFIFDLYNTLAEIHTDEHDVKSWTPIVRYFAERGADADEKTLVELYDKGWDRHLSELARSSEYEYPEGDICEVYRYMAESVGIKLTAAELRECAVIARRASLRTFRLFDGIKELFAELRGYGAKLYLLSNAQSVFTVDELKEIGLYGEFDGMLLSSDHGCRKPDRAYFGILFDKYKLDKSDAVMVGDDPENDGKGARDFGIAFVLADGGAAAHRNELIALAERA